MRLLLVGFGTVGQSFARILLDKRDELARIYGEDFQIVGVATRSRGVLYHEQGLDIATLLQAAESGSFASYPDGAGLRRDFPDALSLIQTAAADCLIEIAPTNLETAQPARAHFEAALNAGMHIVTANKGPIALDYLRLKALADAKGRMMRFESTVMAGTPALANGLETLAGCGIQSVRGILNGTTNYILTQMEAGMGYQDALAQAQELGYAETDPTADVEGWDAAAKVLILRTVLFQQPTTLEDISVSGITQLTPADIAAAQAAGERYKLIAEATPQGGTVQLVRLPLSNPLASVQGATNAITYRTDLLGDVTLIGAGAGGMATGFGLLADLLALLRNRPHPASLA